MAKRAALFSACLALLLTTSTVATGPATEALFGHDFRPMSHIAGTIALRHRAHQAATVAALRGFDAQQATNATTTPAPTPTTTGVNSTRCQNVTATFNDQMRQACNLTFLRLGELFDVSDNSTAANAVVNQFCSSSCQAFLNGIRRDYADCIPPSSMTSFDLVQSSCIQENGQYCAVKIRQVNRLQCDDLPRAACESPDLYCGWRADQTGQFSCQPVLNDTTLGTVCGGCFDRFVLLIGRLSDDDDGSSQSDLVQTRNLICAKSGNRFCLPIFNSVDPRVFDADPSNTMTLAQVSQNVSAVCGDSDARRCMNLVASVAAQQMRAENNQVFARCLLSSSLGSCALSWAQGAIGAAKTEQSVNLLCATNANGDQCLPILYNWTHGACFAAVNGTGQCTSTCAADLNAFIGRAGCCVDTWHTVGLGAYRPDDLPSTGGRGNASLAPPVKAFDNNPLRSYITACNNVSSFNATAAREAASATCPAPAPQSRELRLVGLLWVRLLTDAALKRRLEAALAQDIATSVGCSSDKILNGTLVEDASQRLSLASSTLSNRQGDAASGTKYQFAFSGSTSSDASANAQRFDTLRSNGGLQAQNTASAITSGCTNCIAAPTAAPGQTQAAASSVNLFNSLVGADVSGTTAAPGSPGSVDASSASSVVLSASALLAVTIAALV